MIGFNHAVVGGLIGRYLPLPVALPVALASHFVLDMMPHYGIPARKRDKSKFWKIFFITDFFAALSLAFWAIANHHYAMYACGQLAVLPDFVWVWHVIRRRSFNFSHVSSRYERWHIAIQRYERPWGVYIELPVAVMLGFVLFH